MTSDIMNVGIIGHGRDKFNAVSKAVAKAEISRILSRHAGRCIIVSGRSPMGGVDVWAESLAVKLGFPVDIKVPKDHQWDGDYGFKQRNLDIAETCDIIYVILVSDYPGNYRGRRFDSCYHCNQHDHDHEEHVKSGACWTAWKAVEREKEVVWVII